MPCKTLKQLSGKLDSQIGKLQEKPNSDIIKLDNKSTEVYNYLIFSLNGCIDLLGFRNIAEEISDPNLSIYVSNFLSYLSERRFSDVRGGKRTKIMKNYIVK